MELHPPLGGGTLQVPLYCPCFVSLRVPTNKAGVTCHLWSNLNVERLHLADTGNRRGVPAQPGSQDTRLPWTRAIVLGPEDYPVHG